IGEFTFDDASNCDTIMEAIEELLQATDIPFCRHSNRIRSELVEYATAVQSDPVGRMRQIVITCRKSGQRREGLQKPIATGNDTNAWGPDTNIRLVQLLRDCETRWSSTFNMIDRFIELYPPVKHLLQPFRQKEYEVLHHIHQILRIPHKCQELLSAEKTPSLSLALPAYEALVLLWKELAKKIPELSYYINLGVAKIMEYVSKGRRSRIYALAMIINPRSKFKWIEEHWSESEAADAEKWMEDAVSIPISPNVDQYLIYVNFRCLPTAVLGGLRMRLLGKHL
ncbi:hypothetical protein F5888DRAFT_1604559, partial [Russula emetica]